MDSDIVTSSNLNVQPQAQLIKDLNHIFTVLMLTLNIVSNHKSYFNMQNAFQTA